MECVLSLVDEGTELRALVATPTGAVLGQALVPGPVNTRFVGRDGLIRKVSDALGQVYASVGDAITLAAFVSLPAEDALIREVFSELVPLDRECIAAGELEPAALAGSLATAALSRSVVVRADVGSCGWGIAEPGREAVRGGFGEILGDDGSAYWIGRRGILAALKAFEKRNRNTQLKPALLNHYGVASHAALLGRDHEPPRLDRYAIAGFAPRVFEAGGQEDEVALEILDEAGRELATMALSLINELELSDSPFFVLPAGSVFRLRGACLEAFMKLLKNKTTKANLVKEGMGAVGGGVLLALEHMGLKARPETAALLRSSLKARE